ncbi:MAG TPA: aroma-sacti cluster domain-containing protein [Gemmatimonadales bacterium]|jgi:hypothetical protein|nr:aroma-sacti cluster domain-containing protein [Gemmatimonadales bacterium]
MAKQRQSNVERLEAAGVLDSTSLSPAQKNTINTLTDAEVQHLISTRQKVGDYSEGAHPGGRPWIL